MKEIISFSNSVIEQFSPQISAFYDFNQGEDVCKNCQKKIVAPKPYPIQVPKFQKPTFKSFCKDLPSPPKPFEPIDDDACHCGRQIVKPAPLPKAKPAVS